MSSGSDPALSAYGTSKLALAGPTTTLATELGRTGITLNAIGRGSPTAARG